MRHLLLTRLLASSYLVFFICGVLASTLRADDVENFERALKQKDFEARYAHLKMVRRSKLPDLISVLEGTTDEFDDNQPPFIARKKVATALGNNVEEVHFAMFDKKVSYKLGNEMTALIFNLARIMDIRTRRLYIFAAHLAGDEVLSRPALGYLGAMARRYPGTLKKLMEEQSANERGDPIAGAAAHFAYSYVLAKKKRIPQYQLEEAFIKCVDILRAARVDPAETHIHAVFNAVFATHSATARSLIGTFRKYIDEGTRDATHLDGPVRSQTLSLANARYLATLYSVMDLDVSRFRDFTEKLSYALSESVQPEFEAHTLKVEGNLKLRIEAQRKSFPEVADDFLRRLKESAKKQEDFSFKDKNEVHEIVGSMKKMNAITLKLFLGEVKDVGQADVFETIYDRISAIVPLTLAEELRGMFEGTCTEL